MGSITFSVTRGGGEVAHFETASVDDFYYFRDSVHAALEKGEFGSRFPTFMKRFEPDEWKAEEVAALRQEIEGIAAAFRKMPPKPLDGNWQGRLERRKSQGRPMPKTLFDVFVDSEDKPILGELLRLCDLASKEGLSIRME